MLTTTPRKRGRVARPSATHFHFPIPGLSRNQSVTACENCKVPDDNCMEGPGGLVPDLESPLPPDQRPLPKKAVLADILLYKHEGVVERLMEKKGLSQEDAETTFLDTLMYLHSTEENPGSSPTERQDDGWHEFLMFTRDYQQFCYRYFGTFIHHQPFTKSDKARMKAAKCSQSECKDGKCRNCQREPSCVDRH